MLTPREIEEVEFTKAVRGYKEEEVDNFLNVVILELENLIKERDSMKEENEKLRADILKKDDSGDAVYSTLEAAKKLMEDISASAEKRAAILLKNAELDAEILQREARENVERLTEEGKKLQSGIGALKQRYLSLLETEINRFDTVSNDLLFDVNGLMGEELTSPKITDTRTVNMKTTPVEVKEIKSIDDLIQADRSEGDSRQTKVINRKPD